MPQLRTDLEQFFNPVGVALVGSVPDLPEDVLRARFEARWGDRYHLVNARGGSRGSLHIHRSVTEIPDEIGLAVIDIAASRVIDTVEECGKKGVPYVIVFSAGFSEIGPEGEELEQRLIEVARRHGITLFGPNTNTNAFEPIPLPENLRGGKIGLVTQSGHNGRPIVQGAQFGIGFTRWVPTGNEADLEVADFIEYFAYDDETSVIAGYFEGFKDPAKLRRALEAAAAQRKPVVALKVGSTAAGARMAQSHTGHLSGSDAVVNGLFEQYGVTRVRDLDELLETAMLFAKLPAGTGPRVCMYSISGGSGTLMAEIAEQHGIQLHLLTEETQRKLHEYLNYFLTVSNPVDNGGQFMIRSPQEARLEVMRLIADDPNVDLICVGITGALTAMSDNFAADINAVADSLSVPLVVTWNSFKVDEPGFDEIVRSGVPLFRSFRNCFSAMKAFFDYEEKVASGALRPRKALPSKPAAAARPVLEMSGTLAPAEARTLLSAYRVPLAGEATVTTAAEAARAGRDLGYPVAMKVASPDIPHKSDAGLVWLDVSTDQEARRVFGQIMADARKAFPRARIDGVQVQQQVEGGTEMIVGVTRDATFGPSVMVGTGGVFTEVLADVAVRPLPLDRRDAEEMVRSLRGYPLLQGARGRAKADVKALVDVVLAVARMAAATPNLAELDLNPVVVLPRGAVAVDSLVVLE